MLNLIERAAWTAVQTFVGMLTADGFGWLNAEPLAMVATAAVASVLSALKTLSQDRLRQIADV